MVIIFAKIALLFKNNKESLSYFGECTTFALKNMDLKTEYNMVTINSYEDFEKLVGCPIGTSDWVELSQERINLFADATLDHQWIHVDTERAKTESQFGTTIAHGYLTLSVLPYLWNQIVDVRNVKMLVNYGIDKMKFGQPVLSGQSLNLTTKLQSIQNLRGAVKTEVKFTMNIKETGKKAIEGIAIFIYYFEN